MARVATRRALLYKPPVASGNWWEVAGKTCVAAYQPKGADDLADSYVNLANPGVNNAAPGTAPDWDATNGWKFNGSSHYLTTGLGARKTWSALIQFTDMSSSAAASHSILGAYTKNEDAFLIEPTTTGGHKYWNACLTAGMTIVGAVTAGNLAISANEGYLNGTSEGTFFQQVGDNNDTDCYIGATEYNGGAANYTAAYVQAIALYSATLTDEEVATVAAAMAAL